MPSFKVASGKIRISDPCYDRDDAGLGVTIKAKNGKWNAFANHEDLGSWGERISTLTAEHSEPGKFVGCKVDTICVDSGQAGIFDYNHFKDDSNVKGVKRIHNKTICDDEPWYSICCDRTLSKTQWGVIPNGVVSSSGLGDGCYEVTSYINEEGVVSKVEILFLTDEQEEEHEDEYEEYEE